MRISVPLLATLAIFAAVPTLQAHASTIDFTLTLVLGAASGGQKSTLGLTNIDGDTLTITGSYDTANIVGGGVVAELTGAPEYSLYNPTTTLTTDFTGTSNTSVGGDATYTLELNPATGIVDLAANSNVVPAKGTLTGDSLAPSTTETIDLPTFGSTGGTDFTADGTLNVLNGSDIVLTITPAVAPTPEPSSLMLLSAGLAGFGGIFARRRWLRA